MKVKGTVNCGFVWRLKTETIGSRGAGKQHAMGVLAGLRALHYLGGPGMEQRKSNENDRIYNHRGLCPATI